MRAKITLIPGLLIASVLLAGCAGPNTFTIEGSWQFDSTDSEPIFGGPCTYPHGAITVSNEDGEILGTGEVTGTAHGAVDGYAVCNVYFDMTYISEDEDTFLFSVPGYDDPTRYTRDDVDLVTIKKS